MTFGSSYRHTGIQRQVGKLVKEHLMSKLRQCQTVSLRLNLVKMIYWLNRCRAYPLYCYTVICMTQAQIVSRWQKMGLSTWLSYESLSFPRVHLHISGISYLRALISCVENEDTIMQSHTRTQSNTHTHTRTHTHTYAHTHAHTQAYKNSGTPTYRWKGWKFSKISWLRSFRRDGFWWRGKTRRWPPRTNSPRLSTTKSPTENTLNTK